MAISTLGLQRSLRNSALQGTDIVQCRPVEEHLEVLIDASERMRMPIRILLQQRMYRSILLLHHHEQDLEDRVDFGLNLVNLRL